MNLYYEEAEEANYTIYLALYRKNITNISAFIRNNKTALILNEYNFFVSKSSLDTNYSEFSDSSTNVLGIIISIVVFCVLMPGIIVTFSVYCCKKEKSKKCCRKCCISCCCVCCYKHLENEKDLQKNKSSQPILINKNTNYSKKPKPKEKNENKIPVNLGNDKLPQNHNTPNEILDTDHQPNNLPFAYNHSLQNQPFPHFSQPNYPQNFKVNPFPGQMNLTPIYDANPKLNNFPNLNLNRNKQIRNDPFDQMQGNVINTQIIGNMQNQGQFYYPNLHNQNNLNMNLNLSQYDVPNQDDLPMYKVDMAKKK